MVAPTRFVNRPRRSRGCTGCLGQVALVLLCGGLGLYALLALLAPWNFYFGGHFHLIPGWNGWGRLHSTAAGGDYHLWLQFQPSIPGYRKSPLKGLAFLCTPRGERFRLTFGGDLPRNHGTDLRGVPLHLYLYHRPVFAFGPDRRPRLDLYGAFRDSELVMEDRGSLAAEFRPDGLLYAPHDPTRSRTRETLQVTFHEGSPWTIFPPCPVTP